MPCSGPNHRGVICCWCLSRSLETTSWSGATTCILDIAPGCCCDIESRIIRKHMKTPTHLRDLKSTNGGSLDKPWKSLILISIFSSGFCTVEEGTTNNIEWLCSETQLTYLGLRTCLSPRCVYGVILIDLFLPAVTRNSQHTQCVLCPWDHDASFVCLCLSYWVPHRALLGKAKVARSGFQIRIHLEQT